MCSQTRVTARNPSKETNQNDPLHVLQGVSVRAWNIRTLMDVASPAVTMQTLSKYRVDVIWLLEVRLPSGLATGSRAITKPDFKKSYWLYCGITQGEMAWVRLSGLKNSIHLEWVEWKPVNDHMAYAAFKRKFCNILVIGVYPIYAQMTVINPMRDSNY